MTRIQYNTLIARFQLTRLSSKEQKKSNFNAIFFINSFDFPIMDGAVHQLRIQIFEV